MTKMKPIESEFAPIEDAIAHDTVMAEMKAILTTRQAAVPITLADLAADV